MLKRLTIICLLYAGLSAIVFSSINEYQSNIDFIVTEVHAADKKGGVGGWFDKVKKQVSSQITAATETEDQKRERLDAFCKDKNFASMTKETCVAACPGGPSDCIFLNKHPKDKYPELTEDLECFACDGSVSCGDMGFITAWDCPACEANPLQRCTSTIGAAIGAPFAVSLPKDSFGNQCYDCINVPDTCPNYFGGTTLKTTCVANCKKPDKCVRMGVNPENGFGCYKCAKKPPPPPKTCKDVGLRNKADCAKCPANKPDCRPAAGFAGPIKDVKGNICHECYKKKKQPPPPPPAKECKDLGLGWKTEPCKCPEGQRADYKGFRDADGEFHMCCKCEPIQCYPDYTKERCKRYCEDYGGTCYAKSTERGKDPCYGCRRFKKEEKEPSSCKDIEAFESCSPDPCRGENECVMEEVMFKGKKTQCGFCVPKDEDPTACENHTNKNFPLHRFPSCSHCYKAGMACEEAVVDINQSPALKCAKCLTPVHQRCPTGTVEGDCFTTECVDGSRCVPIGEKCHRCDPYPERCPQSWRPGGCEFQQDACPNTWEECVEIPIANRRKCHKCEAVPEVCENKYPGSIPAWQCSNTCEPYDNKTCVNVGKVWTYTPSGERQIMEVDCQKCIKENTIPQCDPEFNEFPPGANCNDTCVENLTRCMPIVNSHGSCETCMGLGQQERCSEKVPGSYVDDPTCNKECGPKLCKEAFSSKKPKYKCYKCAQSEDEPPPPICEDYKGTYSDPNCNGDCHDPEECMKVFAIPGSGVEHCFECQEPDKCENDDNRFSSANCNNACEQLDKVCRKEVKDPNNFLEDDLECWFCGEPTCEELKDRYTSESCDGKCATNQECFPITDKGIDCHYCRDSAPKCNAEDGKYAPGSNCGGTCDENQRCGYVDGDDSGCQACINLSTWEQCYKDKYKVGSCPQQCPADTECKNAAREGCHECKGCGEYGLMKFCDSEYNCEEGSACIPITPSGTELYCYDCKKKEVGGCSVERGEFPPGKNCYDMCSAMEQKCVPIPGSDNNCESCDGIIKDKECSEKGFDESGKCDEYSCLKDEICRQSKDGKCLKCIKCPTGHTKGTCKEICGDLPCMTMDETPECVACGESLPSCEEEKKHSDSSCGGKCTSNQDCVPDSGSHGLNLEEFESWKGCWYCLDKPAPACDPQKGQFEAGKNCGGACDTNQDCKPTAGSDAGCESCQEKKRQSCEDFDAVDNVYDCSCDPDNCKEIAYVDLPPEVGPCYRCECSYGYTEGECPQECPSGQVCESDKGYPKCHKCVKATDKCDPQKGEWAKFGACKMACEEKDMACDKISGNDYGCYGCREKQCKDKGDYYDDKNCNGDCVDECVFNIDVRCFECQQIAKLTCQLGEYNDVNCSGRCDQGYEKCARVSEYRACYSCIKFKEPPPPENCPNAEGKYNPGIKCGGNCKDFYSCQPIPGDDFGCEGCFFDRDYPPKCEGKGEYPPGINCAGKCKDGEVCIRPQGADDFCEKCEKSQPLMTCEDLDKFKMSDCGGTCKSNQRCKPISVRDDGQHPLACWHCVDLEIIKEGSKCSKPGEFMPGTNCLGSCDGNTECKSIPGHDDLCEACIERACPAGFSDGQCPLDNIECSFGRSCIQQNNPDCHKCVAWDTYCEEPTKKGDCPQECPDGSYCENVGLCYWCKKGEDPNKCPDGYTFGTCDSVCGQKPCLTHSDYPNCHTCGELIKEQQTCPQDSYGAGCGGLCDEGFECVPLPTAKKISTSDWGSSLGFKYQFDDKLNIDLSGCYTCAPKKPECESGFEKGACTDDMCAGIGKTCVNSKDGKCHKCDKDHCYYDQRKQGTCKPNDPCQKGQTCEQVELGGQQCYWCKGLTTEEGCDAEKGETASSNCSGLCDLGYKCAPAAKEGCYKCVEDLAQTCSSQKGEYLTPSCNNSCKRDETCLPAPGKMMECFSCQKDETPKKRCADYDPPTLYYNQCATCTSEGLDCNPAGRDDFGARCYQCEQKTIQECPNGYHPQKCHPYACKEGEVCVEREGPCMICKPYDEKEDDCQQYELRNGQCPGRCDLDKKMCLDHKVGNSDCYECIDKNIDDIACRVQSMTAGGCPAPDCKEGEICKPHLVKGYQCHQCIKRKDQQPPPSRCDVQKGEYEPGANCNGQCSSTQQCLPIIGNDWGCEGCYGAEDQRYTCDAPYKEGACPSDCAPGNCSTYTRPDGKACSYCYTWADDVCYDEYAYGNPQCDGHCPTDRCYRVGSLMTRRGPVHCFACRPGTEMPKCDYGYSPGVCNEQMSCPQHECYQTSGPCFKCEKGACTQPYFERSGCSNCYESGGKCVPAGALTSPALRSILRTEETNSNCWRCEYPESCMKYGEASNCDMCPPGNVCRPGRTIVDGFREFQCYTCHKPRITITIIIITIETPYGRIVLKRTKEPDSFVPTQVMALAQVDESGRIQDITGKAKDISSFFKGGFGPRGLVNSSQMSVDQLSGLLQQGLSDKRNKYSENCFNDLKEQSNEEEEKRKEKEKRKKKKGDDSDVRYQPGDDDSEPEINAPIIACGEKDGKKALAIYDPSGSLVDLVTEKMLKDNPDAVKSAMKKAIDLSTKFTDVKIPSISGMLQKFTGLPVGQITSVVAGAFEKDKKGRVVGGVVPNDPYFYKTSKKKKKMLGFLGSSTNANQSGISLGGVHVGTGGPARMERSTRRTDIKDQYALHQIGFTPMNEPDSAWNVIDVNKKNILVAVIDSGFDMNHEDAPVNVWTNKGETPDNGIDDDGNGYVDDYYGYNFLHENNDLTDHRGHGTFVAGIIASPMNNGVGIAGINPGAIIMPLKVTNKDGETNSVHIARAIKYAVAQGARVINVSLGARGVSYIEQEAIAFAHRMGSLVVVASGNKGIDMSYNGPSSAKHALVVGQTNEDFSRSTVSNHGPNNGILAPGEEIWSLVATTNKHVVGSILKEGYYTQNGTSFSTPMVAATASLIMAKDPSLTNTQVMDIILGTATDMGAEGWDGMTGAGFLNAAKALRADNADYLTVMLNKVEKVSGEKGKVTSLDLWGTVRGNFKEYYVEVGKGSKAKKFMTVAGPFNERVENKFIANINTQESMRGSKEWVVRIRVMNNDGTERYAQTVVKVEAKTKSKAKGVSESIRK